MRSTDVNKLSHEIARGAVDYDEVLRDALRFRALLNTARIRMWGSANFDIETGKIEDPEGWVHFGAEFWSVYPSYEAAGRPQDTNKWGRAALTALADHVRSQT